MSQTNRIRITAIVDEWSMNRIHALREDKRARRLQTGEALVAFNKKLTIARFIDCTGAVHTYYSDPHEVFDLATLSHLVESGFWVELEVGRQVRKKAAKLHLLAA